MNASLEPAAADTAQDENTVIIVIGLPKGTAVQVRVVKPAGGQPESLGQGAAG